jgi:hypothetical protein
MIQMTVHRRFSQLVNAGLVVAAVAGALPAEAQVHRDGRFMLSGSAGVQTTVNTRTDRVNFDLFEETGRFAATQELGRTPVYDVGFATRLWKGFGLGGLVSYTSNSSTAIIEAEVPHPFFFDFPRSATGLAAGLNHRELILHLQGQYWIPLGEHILLTLSAGPSLFDAKQDLVAEITTAERGFPFDEVDIGVQTIETVSLSAPLGFNAGFDLAYFGLGGLRIFGSSETLDHLGLAFSLRFTRASPPIGLKGEFQPALELGGTQAAGGVRFVF